METTPDDEVDDLSEFEEEQTKEGSGGAKSSLAPRYNAQLGGKQLVHQQEDGERGEQSNGEVGGIAVRPIAVYDPTTKMLMQMDDATEENAKVVSFEEEAVLTQEEREMSETQLMQRESEGGHLGEGKEGDEVGTEEERITELEGTEQQDLQPPEDHVLVHTEGGGAHFVHKSLWPELKLGGTSELEERKLNMMAESQESLGAGEVEQAREEGPRMDEEGDGEDTSRVMVVVKSNNKRRFFPVVAARKSSRTHEPRPAIGGTGPESLKSFSGS
jgi:hypothetical protein